MSLNESIVEDSTLEWVSELGYAVGHGPKDVEEQQCIATCLSSIDALITAETQKHEAIKTHKKGLMQQLFPAPTEQQHTSEGQGPGLFPSPEEVIDS